MNQSEQLQISWIWLSNWNLYVAVQWVWGMTGIPLELCFWEIHLTMWSPPPRCDDPPPTTPPPHTSVLLCSWASTSVQPVDPCDLITKIQDQPLPTTHTHTHSYFQRPVFSSLFSWNSNSVFGSQVLFVMISLVCFVCFLQHVCKNNAATTSNTGYLIKCFLLETVQIPSYKTKVQMQ